ncbi:MAG: C40 family peptidase [Burkholderiaceae bacterium]|nr:C40 family peptidase [Burkholderiaceae bacterium]
MPAATTFVHSDGCPPGYAVGVKPGRRRLLGALVAGAVAALGAGCGSAPPARPSGPASPRGADRTDHYPRADEPAPPDAQAVALHALGLVGTPYRYGGNTPESGFDCSGLIAYVYWHSARTATPRTVAQLDRWGQPVPRHELRTGDLVVFYSRGGAGQASHAGIYVGEGRFVHAPSTGGTVRLDHLASRYWAAQTRSYRRP